MNPLFKWVGGKRLLIPHIERIWPLEFNTYFEPFLGAGAAFLHFWPKRAVLSDLNAELMNFWQMISDSKKINRLERVWEEIGCNRETFEKVRAMDRQPGFAELDPVLRAARFYYLVRTSYNGLWRENSKGEFNTPYGGKDNITVDLGPMREFAEGVRDSEITFRCASYQTVLEEAKAGDLVFLDPPYFPLSETANFSSYNSDKFGVDEHVRLARTCEELSNAGVKWILTNSHTPDVVRLYSGFEYTVITTQQPMDRRKVEHMLVWNTGSKYQDG